MSAHWLFLIVPVVWLVGFRAGYNHAVRLAARALMEIVERIEQALPGFKAPVDPERPRTSYRS